MLFKPNEIGVRNGKLNEASWWTIWVGLVASTIGLIGMTVSQVFVKPEKFADIISSESEQEKNDTNE